MNRLAHALAGRPAARIVSSHWLPIPSTPNGVTMIASVRNALSAAAGRLQIVRKFRPEFVIFSEILLDNPQ